MILHQLERNKKNKKKKRKNGITENNAYLDIFRLRDVVERK